MKRGHILGLIVLVIIVIIILYYYKNKNDSKNTKISKIISKDGTEKILTYRLPTSMDSDVFGPPTWSAIHNITEEIPCSICRNDGRGLMIFAHDLVNLKLKKNIFDKENFLEWQKYVCDIKLTENNMDTNKS